MGLVYDCEKCGCEIRPHDGTIDRPQPCRRCLEVEIERLQKKRAGLPRFADDVVAHPGMAGWFPGIDEPGTVGETGLTCGNDEWGAGIEECYSTLEAAEAEGGDDG